MSAPAPVPVGASAAMRFSHTVNSNRASRLCQLSMSFFNWWVFFGIAPIAGKLELNLWAYRLNWFLLKRE